MLAPSFFDRPVLEVAQDLIGKQLVCQLNGSIQSMQLTEIEAYDGPDDLACHGRFGLTKRTAPMFGEAGHFYVFLIYGMYHMLNIVTGPKDYPAAILIRGVRDISGPGRLTKQLGINKDLNNMLANKMTGLWFEEGMSVSTKVQRTPRIGVDYAGEWAQKPYRFVLS